MKVISKKDFLYSIDGINATSFKKDEVVDFPIKIGKKLIKADCVEEFFEALKVDKESEIIVEKLEVIQEEETEKKITKKPGKKRGPKPKKKIENAD